MGLLFEDHTDPIKLVIISIDGTDPTMEFAFARNVGAVVTLNSIMAELYHRNYYFSLMATKSSRSRGAKTPCKVAFLKFQASKRYAFVYGYTNSHRFNICIDKSEFNYLPSDNTPEHSVVFHLFTRLPQDLKLKIIEEMLDGAHLAKLGCTCKEFAMLASKSNETVWKHRFSQEFPPRRRLLELHMRQGIAWKDKYAEAFRTRKYADFTYFPSGAAAANLDLSEDYRLEFLKSTPSLILNLFSLK